MRIISLTIPIIPKAQMRARHGRTKGGFSVTYKADVQRQAEQNIISFLAPYRPAAPLEGPLRFKVRAYLPIPASWSGKKTDAARSGFILPTGKPDLDNLIKNIKDCLTALHYWHDDRQVVEYLSGTGKYYDDGQGPRWEIEIVTIDKMPGEEIAAPRRANPMISEQKGFEL
jgi:Holliday junction resolvase RusA-like endonuclease